MLGRKIDGKICRLVVIGGLLGTPLSHALAQTENPPPQTEKADVDVKVPKLPPKKEISKFLNLTYYQGLKGNSSVRFEGSTNDLPAGLEAYGFLDLESGGKKPGFDNFFGEFRMSRTLLRDIGLAARAAVGGEEKDIARLGVKYSPKLKNGDVLNLEFYPLGTDRKAYVVFYGKKNLKKGRLYADLLFKETFNSGFYSEIGSGVRLGKRFELNGQGRFASDNYRAVVVGGRYKF
jgi:hypothetical protein